MKLFVDDERAIPPEMEVAARDASAAIALLEDGVVRELSLDHDLGENVPTGYDVAAWLECRVYMHGMIPPKVLKVHSANPVGRARILQTFQSIARYCERNGMQIPQIEG